MTDKRIVLYTDPSLHRKFKSAAAIQGMSIKDAVNQALNDWLDKMDYIESGEIISGTGTRGRAARNPEKFLADVAELRNKPPINEDE